METDYDFLYETWNIVSQLMVYSEDIGETPRYPLETFLAGGGDCEDTAILFASMIIAAPVDWDVQDARVLRAVLARVPKSQAHSPIATRYRFPAIITQAKGKQALCSSAKSVASAKISRPIKIANQVDSRCRIFPPSYTRSKRSE